MPSIAALLAHHKDLTRDSYDDMSDATGGAISGGRLHQIATKPVKNFPEPETVRHLAALLNVSVTTILEAFAVSLGLTVDERRPLLAITLPPGTDILTAGDVAAVRAVISQLVDARRESGPPTPEPDIKNLQGVRLAETEPLRAVTDRDRR